MSNDRRFCEEKSVRLIDMIKLAIVAWFVLGENAAIAQDQDILGKSIRVVARCPGCVTMDATIRISKTGKIIIPTSIRSKDNLRCTGSGGEEGQLGETISYTQSCRDPGHVFEAAYRTSSSYSNGKLVVHSRIEGAGSPPQGHTWEINISSSSCSGEFRFDDGGVAFRIVSCAVTG
jgi:hypothetical protein